MTGEGPRQGGGQGIVGCGCLPPDFSSNHLPSPIPSIGHNEVIGVCRVGPEAADPHGREHWAEMLANPRKPVEHWHQLVEVSEAASAMHGHCEPVRTPAACADCLGARGSHSTSILFPGLGQQPGTSSYGEGRWEDSVCQVFCSGQLLFFPTYAKHIGRNSVIKPFFFLSFRERCEY